jgi:hypothetical protein
VFGCYECFHVQSEARCLMVGDLYFSCRVIWALRSIILVCCCLGFGGKLGASLVKDFGVNSIGDLADVDFSLLVNRFGMQTAQWIRAAADGDNSEEVQDRALPLSIECSKTFRGVHALVLPHPLPSVSDMDALCASLLHTSSASTVAEEKRGEWLLRQQRVDELLRSNDSFGCDDLHISVDNHSLAMVKPVSAERELLLSALDQHHRQLSSSETISALHRGNILFWIFALAQELHDRISSDNSSNGRAPQQLTVGVTAVVMNNHANQPSEYHMSRSGLFNLGAATAPHIARQAYLLFVRVVQDNPGIMTAQQQQPRLALPGASSPSATASLVSNVSRTVVVNTLALSANSFMKVRVGASSITSYFSSTGKKETYQNYLYSNNCYDTESSRCDDVNCNDDTVNKYHRTISDDNSAGDARSRKRQHPQTGSDDEVINCCSAAVAVASTAVSSPHLDDSTASDPYMHQQRVFYKKIQPDTWIDIDPDVLAELPQEVVDELRQQLQHTSAGHESSFTTVSSITESGRSSSMGTSLIAHIPSSTKQQPTRVKR